MSYTPVKIKVCGMTQPEQVAAVVDLGVDAIGMILHADSPRTIALETAIEIRRVVPAFISLVGVFVDADTQTVNRFAERAQLDLIQLHGSEPNQFGQQLTRPFIKAIRVQDSQQLDQELNAYPNARAFLLDPYVKGVVGGTGKQLDYSLWPQTVEDSESRAQKLILAGGLSASNVKHACQQLTPWAVDVNSGVEQEPGIKDLQQIRAVLAELGRQSL